VGKEVTTELSEDVEKLIKMKITYMEFGESTKLYVKSEVLFLNTSLKFGQMM